VKYSFCSKSS